MKVSLLRRLGKSLTKPQNFLFFLSLTNTTYSVFFCLKMMAALSKQVEKNSV